MPLSISFDDLRKQCHIDDPKKFKRWLEVEFRVLKDYPKRTADEIASRLGQKIHWDEYRIHERSDGDDGALRLGISMDLADTIERWYSQLMVTNPTPTARYDYMPGLGWARGFLAGGDS